LVGKNVLGANVLVGANVSGSGSGSPTFLVGANVLVGADVLVGANVLVGGGVGTACKLRVVVSLGASSVVTVLLTYANRPSSSSSIEVLWEEPRKRRLRIPSLSLAAACCSTDEVDADADADAAWKTAAATTGRSSILDNMIYD